MYLRAFLVKLATVSLNQWRCDKQLGV